MTAKERKEIIQRTANTMFALFGGTSKHLQNRQTVLYFFFANS
jgi:hypothetical protein